MGCDEGPVLWYVLWLVACRPDFDGPLGTQNWGCRVVNAVAGNPRDFQGLHDTAKRDVRLDRRPNRRGAGRSEIRVEVDLAVVVNDRLDDDLNGERPAVKAVGASLVVLGFCRENLD